MESIQFYKFLQDPDLKNLIEILKVTDDIFDITDLIENQRSDMLAWCLNPNEGHGQGDLILKDFLSAAYNEKSKQNKKSDNYKFLSTWTPGKTTTTGLSSAFVKREFHVKTEKELSRLDLFIIDTSNEIFIVIENKAGAELKEDQLKKYTESFLEKINNNPIFKKYKKLFVTIDNTEKINPDDFPVMREHWVFMNYDWLKPAANRARTQFERGNHSAQLLMAYCQLETGWESDVEHRISELALRIIENHPSAIELIKNIKGKNIIDFNASDLTGINGEINLFAMQYASVCKILLKTQGIDIIKRQIEKYEKANPNKIIHKTFRTKLYCTINNTSLSEDPYFDKDNLDEWPIFILVSKNSTNSIGIDKKLDFNIYLIIKRELFHPEAFFDNLVQNLSSSKVYEKLTKHQSAKNRKISLGKNISAEKIESILITNIEEIRNIVIKSKGQHEQ